MSYNNDDPLDVLAPYPALPRPGGAGGGIYGLEVVLRFTLGLRYFGYSPEVGLSPVGFGFPWILNRKICQ